MADEKSKNLTDTEQKTPLVPDKAEAAGAAPTPEQEPPKPEAAAPGKDKAPEQEPPAPDKAPAQKSPDKEEKELTLPRSQRPPACPSLTLLKSWQRKKRRKKPPGNL